MTKVGYARVSSLGQDLTVQLEKLSDCDKLFKEKPLRGRCWTAGVESLS